MDQQDIEDLVNLKGRWRCSEVGSGGDVRWGVGRCEVGSRRDVRWCVGEMQ